MQNCNSQKNNCIQRSVILVLKNELNMGLLLRARVEKIVPEMETGCPRGVMVKAIDCRIIVSEFVL